MSITVTNKKTTFNSDANPDYDIKVTQTIDGDVQHVNIDSGTVTISGSATIVFTEATNSSSVAYEASRVIKNSSGILYTITGYSSRTSNQWIQVYDATALPADGAIPVVIFLVYATGNFQISFGERGRSFSTGIVVCNSTTGPTKTIGAADCWFDCQYS